MRESLGSGEKEATSGSELVLGCLRWDLLAMLSEVVGFCLASLVASGVLLCASATAVARVVVVAGSSSKSLHLLSVLAFQVHLR